MLGDCKGRIYKARLNVYIDKRGDYIETRRMVLMKSLSCYGCGECGWIDEAMPEINKDWYPIIDGLDDGELYYLDAEASSIDHETGIADGYDFIFRRQK